MGEVLYVVNIYAVHLQFVDCMSLCIYSYELSFPWVNKKTCSFSRWVNVVNLVLCRYLEIGEIGWRCRLQIQGLLEIMLESTWCHLDICVLFFRHQSSRIIKRGEKAPLSYPSSHREGVGHHFSIISWQVKFLTISPLYLGRWSFCITIWSCW